MIRRDILDKHRHIRKPLFDALLRCLFRTFIRPLFSMDAIYRGAMFIWYAN